MQAYIDLQAVTEVCGDLFSSQSGADYAYINEAYGDFPSFLYLWVAVVVVLPTGNAITALTFATYVLQAFFPKDCPPPDTAISLVAASCISEYPPLVTPPNQPLFTRS